MQRAFDAGAVVGAEVADAADDHLQVFRRGLRITQIDLAVGEARFGQPAQVQHHLDQIGHMIRFLQGALDALRQDVEQQVQVIGDLERSRVGGAYVQIRRLCGLSV